MESAGIVRMPMIGDKAPEFRAMTTKGKINFPEDYKGRWVMFFSHPADFTPVCTTEFIAFSKRYEEFRAINTELLGLSIDSLHSHLAWAKNIEEIDWKGEGKVKVPFPIVADISMKVSRAYGMLQTVAKTQTVRAVFIIDPESIVRAIFYYPMSTGRNIDELKRVILSLQKHDAEAISTPADWEPGDDVLLGSPLTLEEAESRIEGVGDEIVPYQWYLTARKDGAPSLSRKYQMTKDKIWLENEEGKTVACIEFPEFETGKVEVTHTIVDPELQGQGIAAELTKAMAEQLKKEGKKAELTCSYAVKWFYKHKEYAEVLLDPEAEYQKAEEQTGMACGLPKH